MFEILIEEMKLRNFSPRTREVYLNYNRQFLQFTGKSPRDVSAENIRAYLLYLIEKRYSTSAVNLAHNALNFYYGKILRKAVKTIAFQKREQKIKEVLSKEEIRQLLEATTNPKHRLMIELLYASGVRVSELIRIRLEHLDLERKMLLVRQGKGKKDRYTLLSEKVITQINDYLKHRKNRSDYLFETLSGHLTMRAVQVVLNQAAKRAGITRRVHPHLLRHSFATHLLESGARESHIQQLLGHKDIRTTQTYARITNKHLLGIESPHENL
ncbi:tyrosine-type recombinase/integrase [Candidatus Woesearchaeota archaeon]|nr:tyrosine-type recombinase/integrase [Candidatus Woesearchaeota archaeon]